MVAPALPVASAHFSLSRTESSKKLSPCIMAMSHGLYLKNIQALGELCAAHAASRKQPSAAIRLSRMSEPKQMLCSIAAKKTDRSGQRHTLKVPCRVPTTCSTLASEDGAYTSPGLSTSSSNSARDSTGSYTPANARLGVEQHRGSSTSTFSNVQNMC